MSSEIPVPARERCSIAARLARLVSHALLGAAVLLGLCGVLGRLTSGLLSSSAVFPVDTGAAAAHTYNVYACFTESGFTCNCWRTPLAGSVPSSLPCAAYLGGIVRWVGGGYPTYWSLTLTLPWWVPAALCAAFPAFFYTLCAQAAWKRRRRSRHGLCLHCGYNLTGNTSGRCPECGSPTPAATAGVRSSDATVGRA